MSPEQASGRNEQLDERSDIYSLCVILHELLTLRHYLAQKSTLTAMLHGVINDPLARRPEAGVPPELHYFLQRGLEKRPGDRHGSVREMIDRLQALSEGEIPVQCPFSGVRRFGQGFLHLIVRRPFLGLASFFAAAALSLYGAAHILGQLLARRQAAPAHRPGAVTRSPLRKV